MGEEITLFLCGDVMTGRGVDQVLPTPSEPTIHEPYMKSAEGYVRLAEQAHGKIPRPVDNDYIWGEALDEFERVGPDLKIINLETAITVSDDYWKGKGINYRMHPDNVGCITAAEIDCCSLANNHVLDWGYAGLTETLKTLAEAGIKAVGAGENLEEAQAPATFEVSGKGGVVVFGFGSTSSGIPQAWGASAEKPGVNLLEDLSEGSVQRVTRAVQGARNEGDIVVLSIHWGSNWGYEIPQAQREFAHRLIDEAEVDLVHGHSSHHVKGIEVYNERLILYGCGDFINDYEGIQGYEAFRDDLSLMYFPRLEASTGRLLGMEMAPTQLRRFQVHRAAEADAIWIKELLDREGERLGTWFTMEAENRIRLYWAED
jgi:poly-gamma-glutamate synthesis protein (capsule biosynthesis protein)